jgi:hypothetical protein
MESANRKLPTFICCTPLLHCYLFSEGLLAVQGLVDSLDPSQKETLQEIAQFAHIKSADSVHNACASGVRR